MHSNIPSTSATVLASRGGEMETISLSARPQVTYVRPWYNDPVWGDRVFPYMAVGHSQDFTIEGYMFTRTFNVYISAGSGVYTNSLSSISAFNLYSGASPLTGKDFLTLYPPFSGRKLDSSSWHIENDNIIKLTLDAPQGVGYIDLIICSCAGYSLLSKDLSGGPIIVRT